MAFELSGSIMKVLLSPLIWMVIIFVLAFISVGFLWYRKRMKLQYYVIEVTNLGDRKVGLELKKAGWFKQQSLFFGLIDWKGEQVLKMSDGRRIFQAGALDFHEFKGKRALIVKRKDDDPAILVPIRTIELDDKSNKLLAAISPADFRDASNEIIGRAEKEMRGKWEKIAEYLILGGIIIFALVSIIVISQMVQKSQEEASSLIKEVSQKCECSGASWQSPAGSGAP